jgi:hypothetical protein
LSAKIELGQNAIKYIRTKLIRFGGMWQHLSERDLASGCVFAYFPRVPSDLDLLNLNDGLFSMEERQRREGDWTSREKARLLVKSYLADRPERLGLIHNSSLRPGRSYPFSLEPPLGYVKRNKEEPSDFPTEIYVYLPGGDVSIADVDYFIETGHFWSMTCALTSHMPAPRSETEIDRAFILECAGKTEHILMNACDGDITLVWSADKLSQDKLVSYSDDS